ncbi:MAG TPA: TrbC/VirB2 family protein [Thiomonas arsenitoxydans]|uniref:TrbC/VirB2 family protein n=1 Tax=Thiomonas arsenitoxydans (strain DSM 22701 / CIP 110005 / 3As) TaxID=426114 RepID=UPI002C107956|nr:TrbC/VirB2 family protein [Thiomonas arsenitoxydans]HML83092.1 TrbC/VirB2 family protein [Thiomonas arsenitoxydans]
MNTLELPRFAQQRIAIYQSMDNDQKLVFWLQAVTILGLFALYLMAGTAHAAAWDTEATTFQTTLTGPFMTTVAIIAVIILGIMALFGKMSWGWAGSIIGGIILIFGGADIVNLIQGAA